MILKGSQRGGAKQLAAHLLKTEENEHVEVHEVRGFVSGDLHGALMEAYAVSRGTKCRQFLFSVSLNPPEKERVDIGAFIDTADRIEKKLGLQGHPRIIVFHEKEGRRHAHVAWSRIDAETMTAKNLPFFKLKLRDISRQLYLERDWKMPRGLMDSQARDPRNFSLVEWQQAKRMGCDARDLKAMLQECWAASDSRSAFQQALAERGLILAKGGRRGFVVVSPEAEVLSVARYVGKKAREVRAKLGDPEQLPAVDEAMASMAADLRAAFKRHAREALVAKNSALANLERRRKAMVARHQAERRKLDLGQRQRWEEEGRRRASRFKTGLRGLWQRLAGAVSTIRKENEEDAYAALQRDRAQRQDMIEAQLQDRQALGWEIHLERSQHAKTLASVREGRDNVSRKFSEVMVDGFQQGKRVRRPRNRISTEHEP